MKSTPSRHLFVVTNGGILFFPPGKNLTTQTLKRINRMEAFILTLSYFLRILRKAIAFMVTYSINICPSCTIAWWSSLKHRRKQIMYLCIPVAIWRCRRCLTLELKNPAISEASFINSEKNIWSHTTITEARSRARLKQLKKQHKTKSWPSHKLTEQHGC